MKFNHHDPTMPVIRDYLMPNGTRRTLVDPDYEQRYRNHLMQSNPAPNWRNDPTYNLRRKPSK